MSSALRGTVMGSFGCIEIPSSCRGGAGRCSSSEPIHQNLFVHEDVIAILMIDVLVHVFPMADLFVVELQRGRPAQDPDFLRVRELPESAGLAQRLENRSGSNQVVFSRPVNGAVNVVFLAVDLLDRNQNLWIIDELGECLGQAFPQILGGGSGGLNFAD